MDPAAPTTAPTLPPQEAPRDPGPAAELVLDPARPLGDGLVGAFAGVLAYAAGWAARADEDPTTAVHEYRKSIRRARALVRLVRPLMKGSRYRELDGTLREIVLETSFMRDAEVLGDTVKELPRSPLLTAAVARLRAVLAAQQAQACSPAQIADVLARGARRFAPLPARLEEALPSRTRWRDVVDALGESYRRCRETFELARHARSDEEIHDWRKRVKELRYQLEMLEPISATRAAARGRPAPTTREVALGKLAKVLGQITDLMVLRAAVRSHDAALGPQAAGLLVDVLDRMIPARFLGVAALGEPFFAARPGVLARALLGVPREGDPPVSSLVDGDAGLEPRPVLVDESRPGPRYPNPVAPPARSVGRAAPAVGRAPVEIPPVRPWSVGALGSAPMGRR